MESIWNNIKKPKFKTQNGDIKTDVLIIGGGLCGILCAYMLKNKGVDYVLSEADEICGGITNGTTAKITLQHGLIYEKITKKHGIKKAKMYYQSQKEAFDILTKLAGERECDFEICDSFVFSRNDLKKIEEEVYTLNKIGCNVDLVKKTELPFEIAGAVRIKNQAKFHPLKFAYDISKDLNIYENTKVIELKPNMAITNNGRIYANKIIVATHFPFINKHGGYFLKMYQHRSYVIALKNTPDIKGIYVDEDLKGLSLRMHGETLLLGGGSHRTGKDGGNWEELSKFKEKYYPKAQEVGRWATQDCMTLDSMPYIGRYSKFTQDLYTATGFNKWGMTSSMLSAIMLKDMILDGKSEYESLYNPSRNILTPQLAVNMAESVKGLITPTTPRCPHLGCALKYNKYEHSWDCSCHGSRFEKNGKLINNPATDDLKE